MVVHSLPAGQPYSKIDKVLIIFFTQTDLESEGEPLYIYEAARKGKPGKVITIAPTYIFVNGQYRNNKTSLGRIIADVMEADPSKIKTAILRKRMNTLKIQKKGKKKWKRH